MDDTLPADDEASCRSLLCRGGRDRTGTVAAKNRRVRFGFRKIRAGNPRQIPKKQALWYEPKKTGIHRGKLIGLPGSK